MPHASGAARLDVGAVSVLGPPADHMGRRAGEWWLDGDPAQLVFEGSGVPGDGVPVSCEFKSPRGNAVA